MEKEKTDLEMTTEEKKKEQQKCWTMTHTVTGIGLLIFFMQYTLRYNLSVAILPMADEFSWDEPTQGLILASFFYGYFFTNVLGGRASEIFGGKIVLAMSLIITAILTVLTPVLARWSTTMLIVARVVEGLAGGVAFPAMNFFLTNWVPKEARARTATRIFTGTMCGTFLTLAIGGWLSSTSLGWPALFYITGVMGIVVGIIWIVFVTDDPRDSKKISASELDYIIKSCGLDKTRKKKVHVPVPWKSILTSFQFWLILLTHVGADVCLYFTLTELPTYLNKIMGFSLSYAGTISGSTYLASWIFGLFYSTIVTHLVEKNIISVRFKRVFSEALCCYGNSLGFLIIIFTDSRAAVVAILIINGAIFSSGYSAYMCSHADISPRFTGTLMGITNTMTTIPGFTIPSVVGAITYHNQTRTAWNYIFLMPIVSNLILTTPYLLFYKAEIEPWNDPNPVKKNESVENVKNEPEGVKNNGFALEEDTKL